MRPLLEYSSIIWSPYHKHGIIKNEAVQRFFFKGYGELRSYKYTVVSERAKNFFLNRVINIRNSLPDNIVARRLVLSRAAKVTLLVSFVLVILS